MGYGMRPRPTSLSTQLLSSVVRLLLLLLLSRCFTSTETVRFIRDGERMGQGMPRAQAHLPVTTAPELCRPSSSSFRVLYVHRNRTAY